MAKASIYMNGKIVGFHEKPDELVNGLRKKRRAGDLPAETSVAYYADVAEVYINTDEGRAMHPVIVVENGKPKLTPEHVKLLKEKKLRFSDLLKMGVVEFLDAEEEENAYIAFTEKEVTPKHTHLEIHPSLMLGVCACVAPYSEHNSNPRITMTTQMLKQALGTYASNFSLRTDTQAHMMFYPQAPIANSKYYDAMGLDRKAAGQNFVVAVMPYYGYNMNDAVVVNKSAIERGLARTIYYRTYEAEERKYPGGQKDRFEKPKPEIMGYRGDDAYKYLDEDGIIEPEFTVKQGDVLVGKTSPPRFLEEVSEFGVLEEKRRENSEAMHHGEGGTIDFVLLTEGTGGNRLSKIRTRTVLTPEIGDKFTARHGQKGVIGMLVDERDLPFTESGMKPDLCINPHAIPSRTTVGFLLELLAGKAGALKGERINSTCFDNVKEQELTDELAKRGFRYDGVETFYDGITGKQIQAKIFTGVVYYQRLGHLVSMKMHARGRGPVQILTRQPTEGRAREGGLRFGEMERDCLISHGAAMVLTERLMEESDKTVELVCSKCGMAAVDDQIRKRRYCPVCGESEIHEVEMGYAFKLLMDELKAMCLYPRLKLADKG